MKAMPPELPCPIKNSVETYKSVKEKQKKFLLFYQSSFLTFFVLMFVSFSILLRWHLARF